MDESYLFLIMIVQTFPLAVRYFHSKSIDRSLVVSDHHILPALLDNELTTPVLFVPLLLQLLQ